MRKDIQLVLSAGTWLPLLLAVYKQQGREALRVRRSLKGLEQGRPNELLLAGKKKIWLGKAWGWNRVSWARLAAASFSRVTVSLG